MAKQKKPNRTIRYDRIAILAIPVILLIAAGIFLIARLADNKKTPKPTPEPTQETAPSSAATPTPESTPEPTAEATPEPTPDAEKDARFFDTDSYLIIANKKHKLPSGYEPSDLAYPEVAMRYNNWTMRWDAAVALEEMFAAAEEDGVNLVMGSGYRGEAFQKVLYDGYVAQGGQSYADSISSRPGYSDHQTGLATDLCGQDSDYDLTQDFENTKEGKWLAANAYKYGFIMRYPKGKEDITGYAYEPWHFRYVTKEEAQKIHDAGENMTFEEFYGLAGGDYAD